MKREEITKIRKAMEKELDAKRYEHTLGVAYTAAALAMRYGADVQKAMVAGLLHDCAKCLSDEKRISICEKKEIPIAPVERRKPGLLHAKVGSYLAQKDYGIEDAEILNAIRYHTTGRPDMTLMEKILYLADFIEPHRKDLDILPAVREAAFRDLDEALRLSVEGTLQYLKEIGSEIDEITQETYEFYHKK